jgi:cell division septum initiation protein DivIVA
MEAYKQVMEAKRGLTEPSAGRRETDQEWQALEFTLAGYIPAPSAMENMEQPPTIDAYAQIVASAVAEAQNVAADMVKMRAEVKHAHEESWNQTIQEAKEEVNQKREANKTEYMKVVRRIKQVQTIARKYIEGRREQRRREEEGRRDAARRTRANYRVTRAMRTHLDRWSEGAMADAEDIEEEPSSGEGSSGNQVDKGETQQQRAEGAKHTKVGKRERLKDVEEEGEPSKAPEEEGGQGEEGGEVRADRGGRSGHQRARRE